MTDEEIVRRFNEADNKNAAIGEIADEEGMTAPEVMRILVNIGGVKFPLNKGHENREQTEISMRSEYIKWTKEMENDLRKFFGEGLDYIAVSDRMGLPAGAVRKKWYNMNHKISKPLHTPQPSPDCEQVEPVKTINSINPGNESNESKSCNSPSYEVESMNDTDNNTFDTADNTAATQTTMQESSGTCINVGADVYAAVLAQLLKACDAVGLKAEKIVMETQIDRTVAVAQSSLGGVSVWSFINE